MNTVESVTNVPETTETTTETDANEHDDLTTFTDRSESDTVQDMMERGEVGEEVVDEAEVVNEVGDEQEQPSEASNVSSPVEREEVTQEVTADEEEEVVAQSQTIPDLLRQLRPSQLLELQHRTRGCADERERMSLIYRYVSENVHPAPALLSDGAPDHRLPIERKAEA